MTALPGDDLDDESTVVVLPGDTPLLLPETLDELVADARRQRQRGDAAHQRARRPDRLRARRARRRTGGCCASSSSATPAPEELDDRTRSSTSIYAFRRDLLGPALRHLSPDNAQGEYYLTDVVGVLGGDGPPRRRACRRPAEETQGVNDRWQLALAERELRARTNRHWLLNGVTMLDPRQTFIDVTVELGRDVTLYPGTILAGQHGRSATAARSARTPGSPTAWSARDCRRAAHGRRRRPRSATAPRSARSPTCSRDRSSQRTPTPVPFYTGRSD